MTDEDAFAEALRLSVVAVPPSPVLKSTAACAPVDTNAHAALPFEEAPDELCCPITLALFVDPVQAVRGQTYERTAFEDWFTTHKTDPMTGENLFTTTMARDRQRTAGKQSPREGPSVGCKPTVRSAGRGGRGGPRQAADEAGKGRGGRGKGGRGAGRGGRGVG
eukprot:4692060-Prymnesium_polylepis.1